MRRGPRAFVGVTSAIDAPRGEDPFARSPGRTRAVVEAPCVSRRGALGPREETNCQVEENTGEKHTLALALATVFLAGLALPTAAFTRVERTARTALTGATTGVPTRVDIANIFVCYVCVCQNGRPAGTQSKVGLALVHRATHSTTWKSLAILLVENPAYLLATVSMGN